ncbi:MAG TPA: PepSY-associated TM helix domain-containing protein [Phenylobacterium sp.]|nr:PepSY-associated TM helix domain-containing protein [Phenylobacterium sp.]
MPRDTAAGPTFTRGQIYRQARLWHGWLSALAFLALMFFAATGLLLNNEDWLKAEAARSVRAVDFSPAELAAARASADPDRALARAAIERLGLRGEIQKPRPGDKPHLVKVRGVTGGSEIVLDLQAGRAQVRSESVGVAATLKNLHKGKNAGPAWRLLIDAVAIAVLCLSLLGYLLFFSLRFRLRTGLILTGVTLAGAVGLFFVTVP